MRMPVGQHAVHDRMELTDSQWMTPAAALAEHYAGRIFLMPPTLKTIEELNTYTAIGTALGSRQVTRHSNYPAGIF